MLDPTGVQCLTFDCYGTLIDWERGIVRAVQGVLGKYGHPVEAPAVLAAYSEIEPEVQSAGYLPYRDVLNEVMRRLGLRFGVHIMSSDANALAESLPEWEPFPEVVPALERLAKRFRIGIISNIDDALFAHSARKLGTQFAGVVTAEQVKSYKPSLANFREAQRRLGLTPTNWVHVAESLFHDIAPANQIGIPSVWVNRRGDRGVAASRTAEAKPELTVRDLGELAEAVKA